jgi:hypothetical protein
VALVLVLVLVMAVVAAALLPRTALILFIVFGVLGMCIKLNRPDRATLSRFLSFLMRCFYAIYAGGLVLQGLTRSTRFTRVCFLVRVENRPPGGGCGGVWQ